MNGEVSRTCTEIPPGDKDRNREKKPRPLKDFRSNRRTYSSATPAPARRRPSILSAVHLGIKPA